MKLLILGASGLVGRNVLEQALRNPAITRVVAPTRKPLAPNERLENPVSSDLRLLLPCVGTWEIDAVICAVGTTIGKAGSKDAFREVDYVLPLAFARQAHQHGAQNVRPCLGNRSLGQPLFFYAKTKGDVERDMASVGFRSLTMLRPSIIGGSEMKSVSQKALQSDCCASWLPYFRRSSTSIQPASLRVRCCTQRLPRNLVAGLFLPTSCFRWLRPHGRASF